MKKLYFFLSAFIILSLFMGCVSKSKYELAFSKCSKAEKDYNALVDDYNEALKRITQMEKDLTDLEAENGKNEQEFIQISQKMQSDFLKELEAEVQKGQISISQTDDHVTVDIGDQIIFSPGQAFVKEEGKAVLTKIGKSLKSINDKQIIVEGHTDNSAITGKLAKQFPTNWELSAARAVNITRFLIEQTGVNKNNISARAFGETKPVVPNNSSANRATNRRIAIVLIGKEKGSSKEEKAINKGNTSTQEATQAAEARPAADKKNLKRKSATSKK